MNPTRVRALSANLLSVLPTSISALPELLDLRVDDNQISSLPLDADLPHDPSHGTTHGTLFPKLRVLGLSVNPTLSYLPPSIGALAHLTQLSIGAAKLTHLPSELGLLTNLEVLTLSGNRLSFLPHTICRKLLTTDY